MAPAFKRVAPAVDPTSINVPLLGGGGRIQLGEQLVETVETCTCSMILAACFCLAFWPVLLGLGVFAAEESGPFDPVELAALRAFKASSGNSAELRSWTGDDPCREGALGWAGVSCEGVLRPTVTGLSLSGTQLTGTVPPELGQLTALTSLQLANTQLSGTIPEALGQLPALRFLDLHSTQLTGTISPELGQLAALIDLFLYSTQLTGTIPDALGQLAALKQLSLDVTQLSGTIPEALGDLAALTWLGLSGTGVTGCPDLCSQHPRITTCRCPT